MRYLGDLLRSFACALLSAVVVLAGLMIAATSLPSSMAPGTALAGDRDDDDGGWHRNDDRGPRLSKETIAARQHYFGLDNVDPRTGAVRRNRVILSWMGVSGFAAALNGKVILMDAYVARDGGVLIGGQPLRVWPSIQYIKSTPQELAALKPELVLIGHTHFDHAGDLPTVVRANPDVVVLGTQEHCNDIIAEVPEVNVQCRSLFAAGAEFGTMVRLPKDTLPGVGIIAVKQPHSAAPTNPALDPPFAWPASSQSPLCSAHTDYPPQPGEPLAWGAPGVGPPSGAISIMWHLSVGDFGIAWQNTAGPIDQRVLSAFAKLPKTDLRLASIVVSGRSWLDVHNRALKPKVFMPIHHDGCGYLLKKSLEDFLASLPEPKPMLRFLSDPSDYLLPLVFDPKAEAWKK